MASRGSQQAPRPPDRRRVRALLAALRAHYGKPVNLPHRAPLDELVLTVLSQNTNDRNRDVAYARLRSRFKDWEAVEAAPTAQLEEAIRPGGISKVKAARITAMLRRIRAERGDLDLSHLERIPREEALEFLESLPGVGRKTAACVLLFSFDRPEMPVDTHVYRVASRLGLLRPRASFAEAHQSLQQLVDPSQVYEAHVNMLRHGRRICAARQPLCGECPLRRSCPHGRAVLAAAARR